MNYSSTKIKGIIRFTKFDLFFLIIERVQGHMFGLQCHSYQTIFSNYLDLGSMINAQNIRQPLGLYRHVICHILEDHVVKTISSYSCNSNLYCVFKYSR